MIKLQRSYHHIILIVAATSGLLWVLIGTITGHESLTLPYLTYMEKAQRYHIIHTLVCLFLSLTTLNNRRLLAVCTFLLGMLCFSGSLYLMAVYHWALNSIVPIGGVCFLIGWIILIYDAIKDK